MRGKPIEPFRGAVFRCLASIGEGTSERWACFNSKFALGSEGKSGLHIEADDVIKSRKTNQHPMRTCKFKNPTLIQQTILLAALSFGPAVTTRAQDFDKDSPFGTPLAQTQKYGISPLFGYRFGGEVEDSTTGSDYKFKDGPAYGLILDYAPPDYPGRFELLWSHQDSSVDFNGDNGLGDVDLTIDVFQVGSDVEFGKKRLREYISAHVGVTHFSSDGHGDETDFSFGIGVGGKAFLTKNIYLRVDLRAFCTVVEAEGGFIHANGVTVASFSGSTLWQGQTSVGIGVAF